MIHTQGYLWKQGDDGDIKERYHLLHAYSVLVIVLCTL